MEGSSITSVGGPPAACHHASTRARCAPPGRAASIVAGLRANGSATDRALARTKRSVRIGSLRRAGSSGTALTTAQSSRCARSSARSSLVMAERNARTTPGCASW